MSKQANKKAIGAFVIAALGLAVAAIIIFGSGKFFAKREQFIAYFQGSVKGLRVGAPVVFRGVRVGEVTKMMIYADRHDRSYIIPVMMEIEPDNFKEIGPKVKDMEKYVQDLIKIGLRAQLQIQSLVTGQLMVNFDFHPDTQASLVGDQRIDLAENVTEIPTVQTSLQKLEKTLENIPIGEIADNMNKSLEGIKEFVASEELKKGVLYFNRTIKEIHDFVDHLYEKVDPLSAGVDQTLKDAQMLIRNVNSQVDPLAAGVKKTAAAVTGAADAAQPAVKEVERAFANIAALTGKGSQERRQLDLTLEELQGAARSIKVWAAYLERNPEALIRGKSKSKRR
jgi:paraquat-inducible protein B